jgi:SAM-dependent methyltransferase
MTALNYYDIISECESDLKKYGDTFQGMGWTKKAEYADLRYRIMVDMIKRSDAESSVSLLDIGCGTGRLYQHILDQGITGILYAGLDLSADYLALARQKFPKNSFYHEDLLNPSTVLPSYDYVVMNGVFTYKGDHSEQAMWDYTQRLLDAAWLLSKKGLAFNVMTKYLDWERDDLFHLSLERIAAFVADRFSRSFVIRHDYGLYEYTMYVYHADLSDGL